MTWKHALIALAWIGLSGCASVPYEFGHDLETENTLRLREGEPQFERGRPEPVVDGLGNYLFALPGKLFLLNWKVDNHDVSEQTEDILREYLAANGLHSVKVRLNQYAPGDEWRRLRENRAVSAFWRYTVGAITVAAYTLLPQRLVGGDNYNPFTNSINIYSDLPSIALHEGGHAKDFAEQKSKGFYAAMRLLPIVPLFQEAEATSDALGYVRVRGSSEEEKSAYRILYPAFATYVGGEAVQWIATSTAWVGYAVQYGPVIPGQIVGRVRAWFVPERMSPADAELQLIPAPTRFRETPEAPAATLDTSHEDWGH